MAYVSPSLRATGDLITQTIWNQDLVANQQASVPDLFTTAGDLVYATAADTAARLAIGTANQFLRVNSGATAPEWATFTSSQDRDVSVTEVVSTVTETTVYSYSVTGGTLSTNKMLRLIMIGDYLNNSGAARNLTLRAKYGATTIAEYAMTAIAASASRRAASLVLWLSANNATNSQRAGSQVDLGAADSAGSPPTTFTFQTGGHEVHNAVAEDSTAAKTLALTVEHSASDANLSFRAFDTQLELI